LVGDDADGAALDAAEAGDDVARRFLKFHPGSFWTFELQTAYPLLKERQDLFLHYR
jgi:hypothetical protein